MDCDIFKNNLNDYVEGNLSDEINNAMDKHRSECDICNNLYNEELSINNNFRRAFNINEIVFESSRSSIIASIDKNRYGKNNFRKLYYKVRKNKVMLLSVAAMFAICIFTIKFATAHYNINGLNGIASKSMAMKSPQSPHVSDQTSGSAAKVPGASNNTQQNLVNAKRNTIATQKSEDANPINFAFTKQDMNNSFKPILYSLWKDSENKSYSACIEGKQAGDADFGIANICLKNLETSKYSLLKIYTWPNIDSSKFLNESDNAVSVLMKTSINNNYTPKFLQWVDNERIMVIIGPAYEAVTKGGDVYLLNVQTGQLKVAYKTGNKREEVESFNYENGQINMMVNVYEDDSLTNYHKEKRTVSYAITK